MAIHLLTGQVAQDATIGAGKAHADQGVDRLATVFQVDGTLRPSTGQSWLCCQVSESWSITAIMTHIMVVELIAELHHAQNAQGDSYSCLDIWKQATWSAQGSEYLIQIDLRWLGSEPAENFHNSIPKIVSYSKRSFSTPGDDCEVRGYFPSLQHLQT